MQYYSIEKLLNETCPVIKIKIRLKNDKPWLSQSLIRCIKMKNKII